MSEKKKYRVYFRDLVWVSGSLEVEATSEEEAEAIYLREGTGYEQYEQYEASWAGIPSHEFEAVEEA